MAQGTLYRSESNELRDEETGTQIRQVTNHPSIHHHPFYYLPCFDDAQQRLIFVSHRTGRPEIFAEIQQTRELVQLTEHADLSEWSLHPSHDGRYVYFTAGTGAWRVNTETQGEEELFNFGSVAMRDKGMVGAAMGTTTLSHDDAFWAIPIKMGDIYYFYLIETATGKGTVITEHPTMGHPEFCPSDNSLLRFGGTYDERIWVVNRDGSGKRLIYRRKAYQGHPVRKEWIVHESWRPGSREIVAANWPHGVIGVDIDTGSMRKVCSFNAWHPAINRRGDLMCADTTFPDRGLQLFCPLDGLGEPRTLCLSRASNEGAHWNTQYCPYDDGPVQVYAPQHTHPHPSFSPDGNQVVFTSDRTGYAQVYVATLESSVISGC
jgi:oligogalacturonide lyase